MITFYTHLRQGPSLQKCGNLYINDFSLSELFHSIKTFLRIEVQLGLGHGLIRFDPYFGRSELDTSEVIFWVFLISRCDCSEVFEFVEEPFDQVSLLVEVFGQDRPEPTLRHGWDVGPSTLI